MPGRRRSLQPDPVLKSAIFEAMFQQFLLVFVLAAAASKASLSLSPVHLSSRLEESLFPYYTDGSAACETTVELG